MTPDLITRREALMRVSLLLGGSLSASAVAGVLAGCEAQTAASAAGAWAPGTLTREQAETVAILGEHIIPETDTPGARAARVHEFIDAILTHYSPERERTHFLAGLARLEERSRRAFGKPFREATSGQQVELMTAMSQAAYAAGGRGRPRGGGREPVLQEGEAETGRATSPGAQRTEAEVTLNGEWHEEDVGRQAFFRRLKELVLIGYYTSEVGATQELAPNPMGTWQPDVPYSEVGHGWA